MTESLINFSTPRITVEGDELPELTRDLLFLKVSEANDGLRHLQARFIAFGPTEGSETDELMYLDGSRFDFGNEIKVEIGPEEDRQTVFEGKVSAISAQFEEGQEPEVLICAEEP